MNRYPNATVEQLRAWLAEQQQDLAEFEQWKKDRPAGSHFHRSAGAWAKAAIREIKAELRRRQ